jgi:peptide/nickel transport system permease protein
MKSGSLGGYVVRRLLQTVPVVLGVVIVNFLLLQLAPGDLATVLAGEAGGAPKEYIDQLRARFGHDQPVYVQLFNYIGNLIVLDLGYSFRQSAPVLDLLLARLGPTLLLMVCTLVLSLGFGILMGLLAALWVRTWKDNAISVAAIIVYATPLFWVGLMLILLFSIKLDWFPTSGMEDVVAFHEGWARVVDIAHHLVLPTVTLSLFYLALYARLMRASMLEQRGLDYVVTARAKGQTEAQASPRATSSATRFCRSSRWPACRPADCSAARSSSNRFSPGRASGSSPTSRCSRATTTCCSASSSCRRCWSSWSI